ncbi:rheb small monomeric GTPase [Colletotrichum higginsianum]|nr:rheb small monomeric GTPase [Colletotrichum higginsianum]
MSKLASFAFEEEEDAEEESSSKGGGIIDIHALRQAGANHRFADSMADLLDRVGTPQALMSPSSRSRRNALLELASKLRDKTFVRQFRDQGAKDALFQAIGQEEDLVSGFVLLSVLLVLFTSYSVPHLVPQLQSEGIAQLASRLFELDEDIVDIAGQRKSNLSRNAQSSLGTLKSTIQQLDLWKGSPPAVLSPRTVALKAVSVLCKDGDSRATRDILADLTDQLFAFAENGWEQSRVEGIEGTNGGLALSLLEGYSIAAMESDAGPRWTKLYLPIVADILTAAMARPLQQFGDFESTMLKLALNTTNNNPAAAGAFSRASWGMCGGI